MDKHNKSPFKSCPLSFLGRWARFFIKKYRATVLVLLLIIVGGVTGLFQIPREGFPEVEIPIAVVTTVYPGATAADVESQVTNKVEEAIAGLDMVDEYSSSSAASFSSVVVFFDAKTDLDQDLQELRSEITKVEASLPESAEQPEVQTAGAFAPDLILSVTGPHNPRDLREYTGLIEEGLKGIDKSYEFQITGGAEREIQVKLDLDEINERGLNANQIQQAIMASNVSLPGGSIENGDGKLAIQTKGQFDNLDQLKEIAVGANARGQIITLDDVADIEDTFSEPALVDLAGTVNDDGELTVERSVLMFGDINQAGDVIREAKKIKEYIANDIDRGAVPDDVSVNVVFDSSTIVEDQLNELGRNAWQGLLVIIVVLFIFISLRSSLIIGFVIPVVFAATLFVFNLLGLTFNVLTLFSLILTLGMLVDNAIVIVEGVQYNLLRGMGRKQAACRAVSDYGPAVVAATVTTVVVFIPIALMGGITGEFIKFIPYTVITALVASLFVALTITPLLAATFMKVGKRERKQMDPGGEVKHWKFVESWAEGIGSAMQKKWKMAAAIFIGFALLFGSLSLVGTGQVEVDIWPSSEDENSFSFEVDFDKGTPRDDQEAVIRQVAEKVGEVPDVIDFTPFFMDFSETLMYQVNLTPMTERDITSREIVNQLREKVEDIEGGKVRIVEASYGPPAAAFPVEVQFTGSDLEKLKAAAVDLGDWLREQDDVVAVKDGVNDASIKQVEVDLDRQAIKDKGLSIIAVASQIRGIYQSEEVTDFVDPADDKSFPVMVGFQDEDRDNIDDLKELIVGADRRGVVKLDDVASVEKVSTLNNIDHFDGERFVEVKARPDADVSADEVKQNVDEYLTEEKLAEFDLEKDSLTFRGDFQMEADAFDNFYNAFLIAIILVYIILVLQFNSFSQPIVILLTVVLAMTGVFFGLFVTGNPVSFIAMIGIIALVGIAVNDSIVLLDQINRFRNREGMALREAVVEGIKVRFKPILSTTVTTIGGILPITITVGFWEGLGSALIFGLIASTVFTLSIIPIFYYLFALPGEKKKLKQAA